MIGKKLLAAPGLSAARQRRRMLRFRSLIGWILFSLFTTLFLALMPASQVPRTPPPSIWTLWGLYAASAGGLLIFTAMRFFRWSAWSAFWRRLPETTLTFSDAGVEYRQPGVRTLMHWDHFTGLAERKGVYALRTHGNDGLIVPQSLFASAELPEIDRLLKERLATRVPLLAVGFEVRAT